MPPLVAIVEICGGLELEDGFIAVLATLIEQGTPMDAVFTGSNIERSSGTCENLLMDTAGISRRKRC